MAEEITIIIWVISSLVCCSTCSPSKYRTKRNHYQQTSAGRQMSWSQYSFFLDIQTNWDREVRKGSVTGEAAGNTYSYKTACISEKSLELSSYLFIPSGLTRSWKAKHHRKNWSTLVGISVSNALCIFYRQVYL